MERLRLRYFLGIKNYEVEPICENPRKVLSITGLLRDNARRCVTSNIIHVPEGLIRSPVLGVSKWRFSAGKRVSRRHFSPLEHSKITVQNFRLANEPRVFVFGGKVKNRL